MTRCYRRLTAPLFLYSFITAVSVPCTQLLLPSPMHLCSFIRHSFCSRIQFSGKRILEEVFSELRRSWLISNGSKDFRSLSSDFRTEGDFFVRGETFDFQLVFGCALGKLRFNAMHSISSAYAMLSSSSATTPKFVLFPERVLAVQKVLSGSGRAGRLRLMGKYIGHRLVARSELDNTFWTDSTKASKVGDWAKSEVQQNINDRQDFVKFRSAISRTKPYQRSNPTLDLTLSYI